MNRNEQLFDLNNNYEKAQFNWKTNVIINKLKLLEKIDEAEKNDSLGNLKNNIFHI